MSEHDITEFFYRDLITPPEVLAEDKGCTVLYPEDNQLLIDIDTEEQFTLFKKRFSEMLAIFEATPSEIIFEELPSKSGLPHRHIVVTDVRSSFFDFTPLEKIAVQFALGSDPIRETLNIWRNLLGIEKPNRLFQPKENRDESNTSE